MSESYELHRQNALKKSARKQAINSFVWGLFLDVSAFVVTVLVTAFTNIEWTKEYWIALGGLLAKTILQASVAYIARRLLPAHKEIIP